MKNEKEREKTEKERNEFLFLNVLF